VASPNEDATDVMFFFLFKATGYESVYKVKFNLH